MSHATHKQAVQEQFAPSAQLYVNSTVHANSTDLEKMIALAQFKPDTVVLDVATGGGHTALAFAPHVREVVASDLTPAMLAAAEGFIVGAGVDNVRFQIADAELLPFDDGTFDIVTCRVAPHHFADVPRFVQEVARVLQPGGQFLLVDTIAPDAPDLDQFINGVEVLRDPTHVRDYTVEEWRTFCIAAGLAVEHTETYPKSMSFDDWCVRARVAPAVKDELNTRLHDASPAAYATFKIEAEGDHVTHFALINLLLAARKPGAPIPDAPTR